MKFLLLTILAAAASASFAPLYTYKEKITGSYIVVLNDAESLTDAVSTLRTNPFFTTLGGRIERIYGTVLNGFSATLSERALDLVRRMDIVKYVEEDGIARALRTPASWGLDRVDQRKLPLSGSYNPPCNGTGVDVYVLDTGILPTHVDFDGRAIAAEDFVSLDNGGIDCNGHGTHCAGTVAGTFFGVACDVRVLGVRVLGCFGSGSWSGIIDGMNFVANHQTRPAVASMSLGGGTVQAVNDAVDNLDSAGVTVVVAAGNSNQDACSTSPAGANMAYTVGATDIEDKRASFSNFGSCVNIFAPGVSITSAWHTSITAKNTISGTSMACPHVAGAAALILEENPTFTPFQVKDHLSNYSSANKISDCGQGSPNCLLCVSNEKEAA